MEKNNLDTHEAFRKQLWINAWVGVAGALGCNEKSTATSWADGALKEFDKRFEAGFDCAQPPKPTQPPKDLQPGRVVPANTTTGPTKPELRRVHHFIIKRQRLRVQTNAVLKRLKIAGRSEICLEAAITIGNTPRKVINEAIEFVKAFGLKSVDLNYGGYRMGVYPGVDVDSLIEGFGKWRDNQDKGPIEEEKK